MTIVQPWSHSKLDTFETCARKFEAQYVTKAFVDSPGEQQLYGTRVHKDFEDYQAAGVPLPADLRHHQPFMDFASEGKLISAERKVALNRRLQPCGYFVPDVWWRGAVDLTRELSPSHVRIVDYKTGKVHSKMMQLHQYAIYAFAEGYETAEVMYYWTQTKAYPRFTFHRDQQMNLLRGMLPLLHQYKEAFKTGIWRPKRNGLCNNHCPVLDCEYNGRR